MNKDAQKETCVSTIPKNNNNPIKEEFGYN
jgi:hypothetical protein